TIDVVRKIHLGFGANAYQTQTRLLGVGTFGDEFVIERFRGRRLADAVELRAQLGDLGWSRFVFGYHLHFALSAVELNGETTRAVCTVLDDIFHEFVGSKSDHRFGPRVTDQGAVNAGEELA